MAGAGDLDGDGLSELLVGAPYASGASWEGGDAYVMLGATDIAAWGSLSLANTDLALLGWGGAGWSVASAGDVNADGFGDLLIGASNAYSEDGDGYVSLVSLVTMGRY